MTRQTWEIHGYRVELDGSMLWPSLGVRTLERFADALAEQGRADHPDDHIHACVKGECPYPSILEAVQFRDLLRAVNA